MKQLDSANGQQAKISSELINLLMVACTPIGWIHLLEISTTSTNQQANRNKKRLFEVVSLWPGEAFVSNFFMLRESLSVCVGIVIGETMCDRYDRDKQQDRALSYHV